MPRPELLSERQRDELRNKGYTLLRGVIDPPWLAALRARFEELMAEEGEQAGLEVHQEQGTRRLADLVNKGRVFDRVWSHPLLLAAVHWVIDAPFHFGSLNARDALPGEGLQALHQDGNARRAGPALRLQLGVDARRLRSPTTAARAWCPDPFGLPRTRRDVLDDPKAPHPDEELITGARGQRGGVQLLHLARRHPEPHPRARTGAALHCYFNPRHLPPQTDQRAYLRPDTAQTRLSPRPALPARPGSGRLMAAPDDRRAGARRRARWCGSADLPGIACPVRHRPARVRRGRRRARASLHLVEVKQDTERHYHRRLTEIYYVLAGSGQIELDGELRPLTAGDAVLIPSGVVHRAVPGSAPMTLLNFVMPAFDPADEWVVA